MDFDPQNHRPSHRSSLYDDGYYSTGGQFRPPKQPRNYGWMMAVLGAFLLCVAGGVALNSSISAPVSDSAQETEPAVSVEQLEESESAAGPAMENSAMPSVTPEELSAEGLEDAEGPEDGAVPQLVIVEASGENMSLQDIYKKVIVSVVSITATSTEGTSSGTGIIMSENGYIITNNHVVSGAKAVTVQLDSGRVYDAVIIGGDEASDLAVLKINAEGLTPAEFGSSDDLEVGDAVVAIGDPLGVELRGTMTDGIICGLSRDVQVEGRTLTLIQTNAALNSGNSGGPLVNMSGQVIGINTMKLSSNYTSVEGIGFAIPISTAKDIVDELVENGYISGRPAFGFTVEVLSTQMELFYKLPSTLYIQSVNEESDAYAKGIQAGDLITAVNGEFVKTLDEFNTIKNEFSAGDVVTLRIYRKGAEMDIPVQLMDQADLD